MDDARSISTPVDQDLDPFAPVGTGPKILAWAVFVLIVGGSIPILLCSKSVSVLGGLLYSAFIIGGGAGLALGVRDYATHCARLMGYSSHKGRMRNGLALLAGGALYLRKITYLPILIAILFFINVVHVNHWSYWWMIGIIAVWLVVDPIHGVLQSKLETWVRRRTKKHLLRLLCELLVKDKRTALSTACVFVERALLRERRAGREPDAGAWEALSAIRAYTKGEDDRESCRAVYHKANELLKIACETQEEEKSFASYSAAWALRATCDLNVVPFQSGLDSTQKRLRDVVVAVNKGLRNQVRAQKCLSRWISIAEMTEVRWQIARCKEALRVIEAR